MLRPYRDIWNIIIFCGFVFFGHGKTVFKLVLGWRDFAFSPSHFNLQEGTFSCLLSCFRFCLPVFVWKN